MDTVSVSKGVFVFKNGFKPQKKSRSRKSTIVRSSPFKDELWYKSYINLWSNLEKRIQALNQEMFSNILSNLVSFVQNSYIKKVTELPTATLLTGINMPDHAAQFATLSHEIKKVISPHVVMLHSQDCNNIKYLVETLIDQLINQEAVDEEDLKIEDDDEDTEEVKTIKKVKKSQCSFSILQAWYENFNYGKNKKVIAVIIPDFEGFNPIVLQNFIQIASNYINILPFVLIFGVATNLSALNKTLPYHVSSKVNIQVFNSQPSTTYLNNILEEVFLTDDCPFHLGSKLFALFLDIFLFYDFSVIGFIQNFKFAMLEHFSRGSQYALCTSYEELPKILKSFTEEDLENVRRSCFSFRTLVENESPQNQIKLLTDDNFFRKILQKKLSDIHAYIYKLHLMLKCLRVLVQDLPKSPLGKQIRELYILATNNDGITKLPEFKEAFQLLGFQSKDELASKMKAFITLILNQIDNDPLNSLLYEKISNEVLSLLEVLIDATNNTGENKNEVMEIDEEEDEEIVNDGKIDRKTLKEQLLQKSKIHSVTKMNKYEKARLALVSYLEKMFREHLRPPKELPFYELYFFNDISIQNNVIGSHRAAIHTALNDPVTYLQCNCCKLPNEASILDTLPDICIAYKLHLEYGKMINLYDWLQAFLSILDPIGIDGDEYKREVDPKLQARFTQCVAELEYLGFVKSSKRKTDHVSRLTWGG